MASLEIPISTISEAGLKVDVTVPAAALKPPDVAPTPLDRITVRGELTPLVGQFLFQGNVDALFVHPCDRCLDEAEFPVSIPVVWTFEEGGSGEATPHRSERADTAGGEDEEAFGVFAFDGTAIDLARPAWDEALLAMPVKFVCREDCLGLCPVCGGNRNTDPCACEEKQLTEDRPAGDSGFAGLKDMFPDLPDER